MSRRLYIADTHFGHENIIRIDGRPFKSLDEMHEVMIERWNAEVNNDDHVYIIGDMCFKAKDEHLDLVKNLKGNKHLIIGNHDRLTNARYKKQFVEITNYKKLTDRLDNKEVPVILSHYYIPFYDTHYRNGILLHGHSHVTGESMVERDITKMMKDKGFPCQIYNVGCMYPYMDYTPRTLQYIVENYKEWENAW